MKLKTNSIPQNFDLWLGLPAPRYTSYPPAPFFNPQVGPRDYIKSLSRLEDRAVVSLYVHIPFCNALCLYCGCNAEATKRLDRVQNYLAVLKQEIKRIAALTGRRRVNAVNFGGGTPNLLGPQDMSDLFVCLRKYFDLASTGEIAMEIDPRLASTAQANLLADLGVNRVSLGAQDFNPEVQAIVNRHQPYEQVAQLCADLRNAGITRLNFDLMYGLPKQTPETIAATARQVCTLAPDRLALFSYAHVPQIKQHQLALEAHGLPDIHDKLAMDEAAREVLQGAGYHAIGIDHFAKDGDAMLTAWRKGKLHRNFQGYTEDATTTLIGLGCSSISQTPDGYFQNEHNEGIYQSLMATDTLPVRRGFLLSPEDRLRGAIIERLMCDFACDVEDLCLQHHIPIENLEEDFARLQPFEEAGLIACNDYKVKLTTPYRMAIRVVCKAFDPYSQIAKHVLSSRTA